MKVHTVFLNTDNCVMLEEQLLKNSRTKKINFSLVSGIQGVAGGKDLTSEECSLGQTILI